jgi:EAL domain-containing protein (putative c-di-GMP-specific phosphodiesterase class I)
VAKRLASSFEDDDAMVARLGGDEFGVAVPMEGHVVREIADRIEHALDAPVRLSDIQVTVEGSIGASRYPEDAEDADAMLRQADTAMYAAKGAGATVVVYADVDDPFASEHLTLLGQLREAIDRKELRLHYQPTIDMVEGRVHGVEALVRWQHPDLGLLSPDRFIPLAENTGLIRRINAWVLDEAARQMAVWSRNGLELDLAVNLSARNLHDGTLVAQVVDTLERHGLPSRRLTLELTETAVMADPDAARGVIASLALLGVSVAIDDFGIGYTSLNLLAGLEVHTLKIDKSFVLAMQEDPRSAAIVASIINLGKALGLTTLAEGVETEALWSELRSLGCDAAQGYYFARPLTPEALETWLRARSPRALRVAPTR